MVCGRDGSIRVWDMDNGKHVRDCINAHCDRITCIGMNDDGSRVLSCGRDGSVRVWDVEKIDLLCETRIKDNWISSACMNDDGNRVAATEGPLKGIVHVWEIGEGKQLVERLTVFHSLSRRVGISNDGSRAVSAGGMTDGNVVVWDVETGKKLGDALTGHDWLISGVRLINGVFFITAGTVY